MHKIPPAIFVEQSALVAIVGMYVCMYAGGSLLLALWNEIRIHYTHT